MIDVTTSIEYLRFAKYPWTSSTKSINQFLFYPANIKPGQTLADNPTLGDNLTCSSIERSTNYTMLY